MAENEYSNPIVSLPDDNVLKKNTKKQKLGKEYREIKPAYFAFIDMLGFKDTFNRSDTKKSIKEVFEYFNSLMEQMRCLNEAKGNCYAGQTSDSLYFYTNDKYSLIDFIKIYLHFCIFAMSKDVYFRGGIAKGTLFVNKPYQFYGDCVIRAYRLEEEISNTPRITVDKKTMEDIKEDFSRDYFEDDNNRNHLKPFTLLGTQDIKDILQPLSEYQIIDIETVKQANRNIKKNITSNEYDDKTYKKYIYLLNSCDDLLKIME